MKTIFDKTEMNNLKLKNRLIRSATWESLANEDGGLNDELVNIYEELASGGIAVIITGLTDVALPHALPGTMGLWNDDVLPTYRKMIDKVKAHDCRIITQIVLGEYLKADSQGVMQSLEADDLKEDDIQKIIDLFSNAAVRAEKAGFDGVQIHAAHGFFLNRFISPAYNHRTDAYGGSPEKRAKILVDILFAIREKCPKLHITTKINFHDYMHGGLTPPDALIACHELSIHGIDSIEISANGTSRRNIQPMKNEAYFLDFAKSLKKIVDTPVILVGGHRSIWNMSKILKESSIEYFSLSRPLIREPNLPDRWEKGDKTPAICISCNGCYRTYGKRCIYNIRKS